MTIDLAHPVKAAAADIVVLGIDQYCFSQIGFYFIAFHLLCPLFIVTLYRKYLKD